MALTLATGLLAITATMFLSVPLASADRAITHYVRTSGSNYTECTAAEVCASVQKRLDVADSSTTPLTLATTARSGGGALGYFVEGGSATGCAKNEAGAKLSATSAGTCAITASESGNARYLPVRSSPTTVTFKLLQQAPLTLTSTNGSYGVALTLTTSGGSDGGTLSYSAIDGTATGCAIDSTETSLSATSAGTCVVTATMAGNEVYSAVSSSPTTVTFKLLQQAPLTLISTSGSYGVALTLTTSGGSDGGTLSYFAIDGTATGCAIDGTDTSLSATSAGTCVVIAIMAGNTNFLPISSSPTTINFAMANQSSLTLTSTSGTYGTALTLTTSGGSDGAALSYSATDGTATGCATDGTDTSLSATSAGTCVVIAIMAGNSNFLPISSSPTTINFAMANQAPLTLSSTSGTYGTALTLTTSGGSDGAALSYSATDGTATGCAIDGADTSLSATSAGTCVVIAIMSGNSNFLPISSSPTTVAFARGNQSSLTLTSTSGTYGTALTLTTSGGSDGAALSYSATDGTATGCATEGTDTSLSATSAGTCVVIATMAGNSNFLPISSSPTTINFAMANQAPLTLSSTSGTYGTALTLTTSGGSDGAALSYFATDGSAAGCVIRDGVLSATSAGTCEVTASEAGNANYLPVSSSPTTVTFTRARPTVQVSNLPVGAMVGGSFVALVVANGDGQTSVVSSTTNVCTASGRTIDFVGPGTCVVTARIGSGTNYLSATGSSQSFSVALAAATTTTLPTSSTTGVTTTTSGGPSTSTPATTSTTPGAASFGPAVVKIAFCGPPGSPILNCQVVIQGQGLLPGSKASGVVHSTSVVTFTSTVGSDGSMNLAVGLPSNLAPGVHHIDVTATNADGSSFAKSEVFTVIAGQRIGSIGFVPPGPLAGDVQFVPSDHRGLVLATTAGAVVVLASLGSSMGGASGGGVRGSGGGRGAGGGYLEDVELEREEVELGGVGLIEEEVKRRSRLGRRPATRWVDRFSKYFPRRAAAVSPVVGRLIVDGDYLRASLGSAWILLCLAAVGFGAFASASTGWYAVPPSLGIFLTILGLSIFDAMLGMLAGASFFVGATVAGHLTSANELRLSFGLVLIWFAIPLAAASLRPLRRTIRLDVDSVWERVADFVVGGLFAAWAAMKMIEALSGLAGVELPIAKDVNLVALAVLGFIGLRIATETFVAHAFAHRMEIVHHEGSLDSGRVQIGASLVVQIALFIFVAIAFLGSNWALYVGAAVFFAPLAAWLFADSIPKSPWVTKWKPTGLVMWTIVIVAGILLSRLLDGVVSSSHLVEDIGFVVLPIPVLIFWTLELFEVNEGGEESVEVEKGVSHSQNADGDDPGLGTDVSLPDGRTGRTPSLRKWAVRFGGVALLALSVTLVVTHVASG